MSYCKRDGDHTSVFVTQEDLAKPEVVGSLAEEDEESGVILPNGEINWDCPCLGGMPHGPCGQEFKDAFSCFHYSTVEEKGSDCIDKFKAMQECFQRFPELYKDYDDDDGEGKEKESEIVTSEADTQQTETSSDGSTSKQLTSTTTS